MEKKRFGLIILAILIFISGCASDQSRTHAGVGAMGGSGSEVYGSVRLGTSYGF